MKTLDSDTAATAATPTSCPPWNQILMPYLLFLGHTERIEQQTDKQQQRQTTADEDDDLFVKVQCGTIHGLGSFCCGLAIDTGIVPEIHQGAELYFVTSGRKSGFPYALLNEA
jgi:hypothetical protein